MPEATQRSFKNRLWQLPETDAADVRALVEAGTAPGVAPILAARGYTHSDATAYLDPSLRALLPDPDFFLGMPEATQRLEQALRRQERIAIFGDYDVDGATSSATLCRYLRQVGNEARIYIPDRIEEGYGPSIQGLDTLKDEGTQLVVIVDAGTVHFEAVEHANKLGMDVVIVDHHTAEAQLPDAVAVINPNRQDQDTGYGHLCAAGMVFLLCVGLNARLRDSGYLQELGTQTDLFGLLDLTALGTVADVVPLIGVNRAFVKRGLEIMGRRQNPGIAALAETAQIEGRFEAYHCGFILGPRVNAGGRIGSSMLGATLLSSDDPVECLSIAQQLDALNRDRQTMEKTCTQMAIQQVDTLGADKPACFAVGDDWHEGIIGIVASRMKDAYDKPAFCLTDVGEGLLKGSARSMAGFDLGAAIIEARNAGLLVKGGGHPMAGGVTLEKDKLEAFEAFICAKVKESPFGETGVISTFDAKITVDQVSIGLADSLVTMEPFGVGNPKPRFIVANALVEDADMLLCKKTQVPAHLRVKLRGDGGRQVKAMAFHVGGTELAEQVLNSKGRRIDIAGTLSVNEWQGRRSAELMIDDARPSLAAASQAA